MKPFWKDLILAIVGVAIVVLAALVIEDSTARGILIAAGSSMIGAAGFKRFRDRPVQLLPFVLAPVVASCGTLGAISWPAVAACAAPISGALLNVLTDAFLSLSGKDLDKKLAKEAKTHGPEAVVCAAKQLRDGWAGATSEPGTFSATKLNPQRRDAIEKINLFLEKNGIE